MYLSDDGAYGQIRLQQEPCRRLQFQIKDVLGRGYGKNLLPLSGKSYTIYYFMRHDVAYLGKVRKIVDGLKDLASEMAVGGYFNQPHGNPAEIPESRQDILDDGSIRITMKLELKRIDGHLRVVIPAPGAERLKQTSLLRAINNARKWMDMLINGEVQNVTDLSKKLGKTTGYVTRILSLNSLAPDIVEAILAGIEPEGLSIAKLTEQPIPEDWNEQRRLYGFPER